MEANKADQAKTERLNISKRFFLPEKYLTPKNVPIGMEKSTGVRIINPG